MRRPGGAPQVLTFGAPAVGEVLADRYRLEEHVADDAPGRQIWRGVDVILRRPVAVVLRYPGGDSAGRDADGRGRGQPDRPPAPRRRLRRDRRGRPGLRGPGVGRRLVAARTSSPTVPLDPNVPRRSHARSPTRSPRCTPPAWRTATSTRAPCSSPTTAGSCSPTPAPTRRPPPRPTSARSAPCSTARLTGHWPHAEAGPTPVPDAIRDNAGTLRPRARCAAGVPAYLDELADRPAQPRPRAAGGRGAGRRAAPASTSEGGRPALRRRGLARLPTRSTPRPRPPSRRRRAGRKLAIGVAVLLVIAAGRHVHRHDQALSGRNGSRRRPAAGRRHRGSAAWHHRPKRRRPDHDRPRPGPHRRPAGGDRSELAKARAGRRRRHQTAWRTESLQPARQLRQPQAGHGHPHRPRGAAKVGSVQVELSTPGATVELRSGDSDPGDDRRRRQADRRVATSSSANRGPTQPDQGRSCRATRRKQVRYLLVWITKLPPGRQRQVPPSTSTRSPSWASDVPAGVCDGRAQADRWRAVTDVHERVTTRRCCAPMSPATAMPSPSWSAGTATGCGRSPCAPPATAKRPPTPCRTRCCRPTARADRFRGESAVTTWLHRIVVNACLDRLRRRQSRPTVPLPEDDRTPGAVGRPRTPPSYVRAALAQLPARSACRAGPAWTCRDTRWPRPRAMLGVAEGTIKSRCARGRARLAVILGHLREPDHSGTRNPRVTPDVSPAARNASGTTSVGKEGAA